MSMTARGTGRFEALQYVPGQSPLHRLDARSKLLTMAIIIAGVLIAGHPQGYAVLLLLLAGATAVGRIDLARVRRAFGLLLVFIVIGGVVVAILTPGKVVATFGPVHVTDTGRDLAIRGTAQTLVIIYTGALMVMTTAPSVLGNGLVWFMNPLRRLRVPVDEIAVMVSLGLAFLPLLQQELQRILLAQRARGADFRRGTFESRLISALNILPPLLASNLRRAEELAVAMEARGYVPGAPRTLLNAGRFGRADAVAILLALVFAIIAVRL